MATLLLQIVVVALQLGFAGVALMVGRRSAALPGPHGILWGIVGLGFGISGLLLLVQNILGTWAYFAGPESVVWAEFVRWRPIGNHGRTAIELAMCALLTMVLVRGGVSSRFRRLAVGVLLVGMVLGIHFGMVDVGAPHAVHYSMVAVFDTVLLVALLAMLVVALVTRGMDWLLWVALVVHGLNQAFNAIWTSAMAWIDVPEAWSPRPWMIQFYMSIFVALMLGLALWRLALARQYRDVPSLLEIGDPPRIKTAALP